MSHLDFLEKIKAIVSDFRSLDKDPLRIIGHLDADGISAASILINAFSREDYSFSTSLVMHLDENFLDELLKEDYKTIIFVDIGSSFLDRIEKKLKEKNIFILDHHHFDYKPRRTNHLNPNDFGLDYDEISGSGVAYFFSKYLNPENKDLAWLGFIGALGDFQDKHGVKGLNKKILDEAMETGQISVEEGLTMFRSQIEPLPKILENSVVPYIPGVSGSRTGALNFLNDIGIELKKKNEFRRLSDLNDEELKKLITEITLKRLGSDDVGKVFGPVYLMKANREIETDLVTDLKHLTSLLNACGRLNRPSLGIGICLGHKESKKEAEQVLEEYRKEVIHSLDWFYKNKDEFEKENIVIVNAENNIKQFLTGTLAGILSESGAYDLGEAIIVMARTFGGEETKISARLSGGGNGLDLRKILSESVAKTGDYVVGGHKVACGALISSAKEEIFLKNINKAFSKITAQ